MQLRIKRLCVGISFLWAILGVSAIPLRESAIVPVRHHLNTLSDVQAGQWAAGQLQARFDPHVWMAIADFSFHQKNIPLAMQLMRGVPAEAPPHMNYLFKGIYETVSGNIQMAQMYFDSATRAADRLIVARGYYYQGELIYQGLKAPQKAPRELERMHYFFQKSLEFNPEYGPSYFGIARRYIYEGKWMLAIKQLEMALKVDPDDVLALYNLGIILAQQRSWAQAYEYLHHAHVVNATQADVARELVRAAYHAGREDVAQAVLSQLLKSNQLSSEEGLPLIRLVLFQKIERDFQAGHVKKALNQYLSLEKLFPDLPDIQIRMGMCYRELGASTYRQAQNYFQRYIRSRPKQPEGYFEMGVLAYKQSQRVQAAGQFLSALSLSPQDNGNIWLWSFKTLYELKLYDAALYVIGKADASPYLDLEYRDVVAVQKQKIEKELKATPGVMQGMTFSSIERLLQQMNTDALHAKSSAALARP